MALFELKVQLWAVARNRGLQLRLAQWGPRRRGKIPQLREDFDDIESYLPYLT